MAGTTHLSGTTRRLDRRGAWYKKRMPSFRVETPQRDYDAIVERGCLRRASEFVPASGQRGGQHAGQHGGQHGGKLFVVTTADVWELHGSALKRALAARESHVLFFPGGEPRKRLAEVEALAEQMIAAGGDRSSVILAFGGGIVGDLAGFLAAIFMRGIPVIQIPTTLLAQVDAAVGGKTGVNLVSGKNLLGSFHQPLAVLIDPDVLKTLPEREYRAGLYESLKCGIIGDPGLFRLFEDKRREILDRDPVVVEKVIAD